MSSAVATIFLYEDDVALAREIILAFAAEGMAVEFVTTEEALRSVVELGRPSALIMDRMIGDFDSLAIIESVRASGSKVPVLVISSRASVDDRILGLRKGGDDYLIKPFAMGELIARVEALRRRSEQSRESRLKVGSLLLDRIDRTVTRGNREIVLPPREFRLLEYFMLHAGQVVTRTMLLEDIWNFRAPVQTNVVDVHVSNLRRKIEAAGESRMIANVPGVGFTLAADATT